MVKIGNQRWMAENLNYYTPSGSWYYDNDSNRHWYNYGRLYLWETALNAEIATWTPQSKPCGVCPEGWRIPSDEDWTELTNCLSSLGMNGNDLKEPGLKNWKPFNAGTNTTNFTARPAGTVWNNGQSFANVHVQTVYITSTLNAEKTAFWGRVMTYDTSAVKRNPVALNGGWSVRCVQN